MSDNTKDCPKIQWSIFSPNGKEQYVLRVEEWEEFKQLKIKVLSEMRKDAAFPDDIGSISATHQENVQESAPKCIIHNVEMNFRPTGVSKNGRPYPAFYGCPTKDTNGKFCTYTVKIIEK